MWASRQTERRAAALRRQVAPCAAALVALLFAGAERVAIAAEDPPGKIAFTAENALTTAHGQFRRWRIASATIDDEHPERGRVEVVVDLSSIDTENAKRDDHLRSADFLDVARYPEATVRLENFRLEWTDSVAADVTLDLHGRKKTFLMTFRIVDWATRRIEGKTTLDRTDFGVGSPENPLNPMSIEDEVQVTVKATVPSGAGG